MTKKKEAEPKTIAEEQAEEAEAMDNEVLDEFEADIPIPAPAPAQSEVHDLIVQGERGGVAWTDLYGKKKVEDQEYDVRINLTSRADNPETALRELLKALVVADTEFHLRPYQVGKKPPTNAPAPSQATPPPAAGVNGGVPPAKTPAGPPEPEYVPVDDSTGTGTMIVTKMTVTPRTDGKTKLDFFEAGMRYPNISAVMEPAKLAAMMQTVGAWTPAHFQTIATYDVNYGIQWRNSERKNQNGNPYKNIVGIYLIK